MKSYEVTFTAPAQLRVHVLAETPQEALLRAEEGNYEEADDSGIEFVKGRPYTTKVREITPEG